MAIQEFRGKYRFLSNFFPALCNYEGIVYPTAEHAYQAAKSTSQKVRQMVAIAATSGEAKRIGQTIALRPDWEEIKLQVMEELVRLKFSDRELAQLLIATGDEELVEGNWWGDKFWGVCNGEGENNLGKILMRIRNEVGGSR